MDTSQFYLRVNETHEQQLVGPKSRGERPWEGLDFVYLVSQNQADLGPTGGRDGAAVMVLLQDRSGSKRAALALNQPGRPFRLSNPSDLEPGGAIFELKRIEAENLAGRRLADAKADRTRPFVVQVPQE